MTGAQIAGAHAHLRTKGFMSRLQATRAAVDAMCDLSRSPYVAFSCGKDSSAMLHVIASHRPQCAARMLTGGESRLLFREIDDIFAWWRKTFPRMDFDEVLIDHVFADGWEDAQFVEQHLSMRGQWNHLHASADWDGVFLGLRDEESGMRKFWNRARVPGVSHPIRRYVETRGDARAGHFVCSPLAKWRTIDVESYIIAHDIPVLNTYYRDGFDARTHTRIGNHSIMFGQIAELRARDPDSYYKLIERFPELSKLT